ncbi:hypothetical protein [Actinomadura sp. NPDC049753]|uniref:hypothetical protein n=1 Tax=Actinomadura sp. NPDC049753 TaxID=3154739 RepID=UPI00341D5078
MRKKTRRLATTVAASALLAGGLGYLAAPAMAYTEKCTSNQDTTIGTPGTNVSVHIKLCIVDSGGYHQAVAYGTFSGGGGTTDKFDNFDLKVRVERYDSVYDTHTCDFTSLINNNSSSAISCGWAVSGSSYNYGWSADGAVNYDINLDGLGGKTWNLTGTPTIY